MKLFLILLFAAVTLLSAEPQKGLAPTITPLEQDIIEATLSCGIEPSESTRHVIEDTTSLGMFLYNDKYKKFTTALREQDDDTYMKFARELREEAADRDPAFRDALEDFIRKNASETKLIFSRPLSKQSELVARDAIQKIFSVGPETEPNGWDLFYKRFSSSQGLLTISRPGIDAKHTVAILYLGRQSHYVVGAGQFYILKFNGKKWVLQDDSFGPCWES